MRLKSALEMGKDCGLSTICEAILNVEIHAISLFNYEKIDEELEEMYNDVHINNIDLNEDMSIDKALEVVGSEAET
jgi:hypothetical protein